ncbi:MAG TPA: hypothetical protein PKH98_06245 [Candidatus Omnitrophota bacterium]|nr:hypothetical protein [Candidatus Omnitrophota bacterium]
MTLINNKMKQFAVGNWGKPKGAEKGLKLRHLDIEPRQVFRNKKKSKKEKRKYIYKGHCCPFCHDELPLDESLIAKKKKECKGKSYGIIEIMYRVTTCPKCKAYEVKECPACKRKTWFRQGWYKHKTFGCGFDAQELENSKVMEKSSYEKR